MVPFDTALVTVLVSQGLSRRRAQKFEEHLDHFRPCGLTGDMLASYVLTFASNHEHLTTDSPSASVLVARVEREVQLRMWEDQQLRYR